MSHSGPWHGGIPGSLSPAPAPAPANGAKPKLTQRRWWPWTRRILTWVFFALVAFLLVRYARRIDWDDVLQSLRGLPPAALAAAVGLAAASHLLYSTFDLIGRHYTQHTLRKRVVMLVTFTAYTFNLCLGSLVGSVALRYRLYTRLGLPMGVITRVMSLSMLTNWLGYMLLGGFLFLVHPIDLPPSWKMSNGGLQLLGAGLMTVAAAYFVACWRFGDHVWTLRGHELYLPTWRTAILQLAMSCTNWILMASIVYVLLLQKIPFTDVLTVLLMGAIAGVVLHVPAGLGVFEAVFITMLGHRISEGQLLAALLGYRAVYYLGPLGIAALTYLSMEVRARRLKNQAPSAPA
jgi:uncharacterized membrane protein YbhN (UPF0104 family)